MDGIGRRDRWPIWGHDSAVDRLQRSVRSGNVSHAYLFSGPDGVGKRTLAKALAAAVACPTPRRDLAIPCGQCASCRRVARETHPDIQTLSLATQAATIERPSGKNTSLTIDSIRALRSAAALRPLEAGRRMILIDNAETLQEPAQEALLKTLEEPPHSVTIVLLANEPEALLPTVRSRCQHVELRPVGRAELAMRLHALGTDEALSQEIAGLAKGRPGWAIRAAADVTMRTAQNEAVDRALVWIKGGRLDRLITAVRLGDGFSKRRDEIIVDLQVLMGVWRDLLLIGTGAAQHATFQSRRADLTQVAQEIGLVAAAVATVSVQQCLKDLEGNIRPRLALEGMVERWPHVSS